MSDFLIRFNEYTVHTRQWLDDHDRETQVILAKAKENDVHPRCECTKASPSFYIAKRSKFYLAKMPGTGKLHNPACTSFELDGDVRGLNAYEKSVVKLNSDGMLAIKIHAPFSHKRVDRNERVTLGSNTIPSVQAQHQKQEAMSLSALLAILWEQAELNRWYPLFAGKRSWGVVRKRLAEASENIVAKRTQLSSILFIPESFKLDRKDEIDSRRKERFNSIMRHQNGKTQYMVAIGRIRNIEVNDKSVSIRLAQQGNNVVYWGEKFIATKIESSGCMDVLNDADDQKVMVIMIINRDDRDALMIRDIGFLQIDDHFLPSKTAEDVVITKVLIEGERDFIKTMPYDTTNDNVYPDFMLLDTGLKPTPLAIFHAFASEDTLDARHKAKTRWEAEYNTSWIWNIEHHDKTYPKIPFKQEK
jgi:hypothetical protein